MTKQEKKMQSLFKQQVLQKEVKEIIDKSTPSPLYKTVFNQAEMYNKAHQLLESQMKESGVLNLISPMIMNLCFSIELLLKSFILFKNKDVYHYDELPNNGKDIHGHKYSELFNKIDAPHKKSILSELSMRIELSEINESDLKNILVAQNCDNSFAEWRYIFEQTGIKQINVELLTNLKESLGVRLLELIKK